ncbi:hypothetical protein L798_08468 [Zootermopsis nevadensis]|uniref:Uncharacterized protein n=1 Tax=Zootermopsis nevadensis TaxID=136037 RepID=A0A067RF14_ZOONE|nr:hypothetical protein L798_08468 [Zootermopsis nevadensis]
MALATPVILLDPELAVLRSFTMAFVVPTVIWGRSAAKNVMNFLKILSGL